MSAIPQEEAAELQSEPAAMISVPADYTEYRAWWAEHVVGRPWPKTETQERG